MSLKRRDFLKSLGLVAGTTAAGALVTGPARATETDWFKTINRAADPANPTGKALDHAPEVILPETIVLKQPFWLRVDIGRELHPMNEAHWIEYIEVYLGTRRIHRLELSPYCPEPRVRLPLAVDERTRLRVWAYCNLDGLWETALPINPLP
jgi:superoxide reductase